jgi:AcrR family transcriptional regulator
MAGAVKTLRRVRRKRGERRAEIAAATLQLMAEHGLSEATNTRIAAAVGISEPALYAHFENRLDILVAAMDVLAERIVKWTELSSNANILERLREVGEGHASFMAGEVEGFVLPTFEFIASPPHLGLNQRFGQRQLEIVHVVARLVEEGKRQGTIREDLDPEDAAWELIMFAWAEDIARLAGLDQFITDGVSRRILDLFVADWAAKKEP